MKKLYTDFFLFFDISVLILCLVSSVVFLSVQGITWWLLLHVSIGLIVFMFSEYFTHRFLFHLKAPKNPFFLNILKRLHYDHHTNPNDLHLLFLPIWYSIPNFAILSSIYYVGVGSFTSTIAFGTGLIAMLLAYEWKHYVAHRPLKPKTRLGKWLKKTHILHHYKNENYWFGVSNPFMDILFGTLESEKKVQTSETAKNLENSR